MGNIKINFDPSNIPEPLTFVLSTRSGNKIDQINNITDVRVHDMMSDCPEISFTVHQTLKNDTCTYWNDIVDFKIVWCKEWDTFFQLLVSLRESDEIIKNVTLKRLAESELSEVLLYNVEINTEADINREAYTEPTIVYNKDNPAASLLHRILEKVPHYSIKHVDVSLQKIQRTFSFDKKSIRDVLTEIAEELNCLVVYHSGTDENGKIERAISLYDLESTCYDCGYRGEYTGICPKCGSSNIYEGYGEDTTICVSKEDLGEEIELTVDVDSVKNCFKLEAGDDLMTATIANSLPNGTGYLWYIKFNDVIKNDMSPELVSKLDAYDELYDYYNHSYESEIPSDILTQYNSLVDKYASFNEDLSKINIPIVGYSNLMNAYYDTIDMALFLQSGLLPTVEMSDTSASEQVLLLTSSNISPVALSNIKYVSLATAESAVLSMAKVLVDSRYQVKVNESSLSGLLWTGNFTIINYSDDEDTATSSVVTVQLNDDYETFLKQKIDKTINKDITTSYSGDISSLFKLSLDDFKKEIKKYCLDSLVSYRDACQGCLDIMVEQGVANNESWAGKENNLYETLYLAYYDKLTALESEIKIREDELHTVIGTDDSYGLQTYIDSERNKIHDILNLEKYLGTELWLEFIAYRREDTYSNSNYISDGLNNAELFKNAADFIETAEKEIYKSANLQHQITTQLKNILVIEDFKPIVKYFSCGNWIRVKVNNELYKLRLIDYEMDFENLENISVVFSDVKNISTGISDAKSIVEKTQSMTTSYSSTQRQAKQGSDTNSIVNEWFANGLNATHMKIVNGADNQTQTWDSHGLLFQEYDPITGNYSDTQSKIINSTYAITDDNWKSTKTAIGKFRYIDPTTNEEKTAFGVNGETLVGKMILGETLGIYNQTNSLSFDNRGLIVSNGTNSVSIDPNNSSVLTIKNKDGNVFGMGEDGNLSVIGDITAKSLTLLDGTEIDGTHISGLSDVALSGKYEDLSGKPDFSGFIKTDGTIGNTPSEDSTGFVVSSSGLLKASNAVIYGSLYSSSGNIGGLDIGKGYLRYKSNNQYTGMGSSGTPYAFFAGGSASDGSNGTFRVSHAGKLYSSNAEISGMISANNFEVKESIKFWLFDGSSPTTTKLLHLHQADASMGTKYYELVLGTKDGVSLGRYVDNDASSGFGQSSFSRVTVPCGLRIEATDYDGDGGEGIDVGYTLRDLISRVTALENK